VQFPGLCLFRSAVSAGYLPAAKNDSWTVISLLARKRVDSFGLLVVIHHTSAIGVQPSNDADVVFAAWLVVHAHGRFPQGGTSDAQSRLAPTHSRVVLVKIPLEVQ
jgi:hypothetical protein